jgi:hypothetical protein
MARSSKPRKSKATTVRGDQYIAKDIGSDAIVNQGKNKVAISIQKGVQSGELAALFEKIYQQIESRPKTEAADKEEIVQTVQRIQTEVTEQGEQANETRLQRWMDNLNQMAPDIVDVIIASLGGPVSAATAVLKKIAERAHQPAKA